VTQSKLGFLYFGRALTLLTCSFATAALVCAQDPDTTSHKQASAVTVGAYINDVQALNLREHSYAIDLYIWFRWHDIDLNPADTLEMVNPNELWGHASEVQSEQPIRLPSGEFYQVLRIQGRFSHKFFFNNYPYDRQKLLVVFEDKAHEVDRIRYVADQDEIAVNPALGLPGFRIGQANLSVEDYQYVTDFGDPRRNEPHTYSRVTIELPIHRPLIPSTLKMLLPVLCVVLGASLMLRLRIVYVDARLGIGITSLLTVVAIQLAANETMPSVDYLVLMDKIHLTAYAYVLGGLAVVLITARRMDRNHQSDSQKFQSHAFWSLSIGFVVVIAALVGHAIWAG
jgi:hypothetical protein